MSEMLPLDPLHLPLQAIRLIEASAGTGKTWTLAALYLRLVLGHGGQPSQLPAQILVVTFTRAATAELRERIRERLATAAAAFRGQQQADDFLQRLIAEYPNADERAAAARQLDLAAQWMDEAAVYTIHGWCQRMLAQHAFEGSEAADDVADENARLAEAVRDYWRRFYAPLDEMEAACIAGQWRSPQALQHAVRPLLKLPLQHVRIQGRPLPDVADLPEALRQHQAPRRQAEQKARVLWQNDADTIESMLRTAVQTKALKNNIFLPKTVERELPALRKWASGDDIDKTTLERYTQAKLDSAVSKGNSPPAHKAFEAVQALLDVCKTEPPLGPLLLSHALPWVTARIDQIRERQAKPGFDDMLRQLDAALHGQHGEQLADTIAAQYPVALIDEFQDTDPLQWRIFQHIYANRSNTGLLLIGDPKQAIYAFRGADIHTYLAAREQAQSPTWTLTTNYRSTSSLVTAVNRVFQYADQWQDGAFAFGHGAHGLPFQSIRAAGAKQDLLYDGQPLAAIHMEVFSGDKPLGIGVYMETAAAYAATYIVDLLDAAQAGRCAFVDEHGGRTALRPRDIAVLVRSRREAACIRTALRQRGVHSVYLSENDSVYATEEAADILLWLHACAMPASDRAMRAALASATMQRSLEELDRLNHDEAYWEGCGERFRELQRLWQRHGALAMLHNLLHVFDLPARLLAKSNGERVLTNLQHLAELLQHAAANLDGEYALIRHLASQITRACEGNAETSEEQVVRLESEADLVKVVTIHKSKGLQYPVVMLPFVSRFQDAPRGSVQPWHDDAGKTWIDLEPDAQVQQRMDRERLQEDLRLLYVALTRAEHACWLGVACVADRNKPLLHRSAFGYVLSGGAQPIEPADLLTRLEALRDGSRDIDIHLAGESPGMHVYRPPYRPHNERQARVYTLPPPESWWISSYSALTHGEGETMRQTAPDTATQDVLTEAVRESVEWTTATIDYGMHAFPRGADAGTFLHDLLEWIAEAGFAAVASHTAELEQQVARRCQRRGWQQWISPLSQWLPALLQTSLALPDGDTLALAQLADRKRYQAEMEFWFEAHRVDTQQLDQLVTRHTLGGLPRPSLPPHRVNGMLKGFIDLIVEQQGRYYVIDYKSNWLGDTAAAYTAAAMRDATLQSRYDLQYAIYTLALHRLLRARLPGYHYEHHVGGVLYLYLRGVDQAGHGVHTERLPFALIDAMDRLFAQEAVTHVA
ncbi:exodeoxyribonuclease V subunit beta [Dyella nitratireducens]|uniref:RecBCD enzyme subunit RecB n=1 Tax=Dyella nitratireducens TaxID=1849580 RepID=A0ABQ1GN92_9GAMM|nr:exodeoxyribonuclease V subunit beta [Dyella nitratireducens]GGA47043.1 RecBCD enzyme subunit RecB [Dyella nitratireducens]GLQ41530.1 RecBCD enzyme subunit RecB [Dyella nitratireducens]